MKPEPYIQKIISKAQISKIRSLSQKKYREEYGLFVAEGEKMVDEALSSGFLVDSIFSKEDIGEKAMSQISSLASPPPVLAVVNIPDNDKLLKESEISGLSIALDNISDPGNMGTIMRLADWFGIETIYASKHTVDIYNPKVVQASMGAIFRVKVVYVDIEDIIAEYKRADKPVYGTFLEGDIIYETELLPEALVVFGNESEGIRDEIGKDIDRRIFIPPYPASGPAPESLNVAVAAAIVCSEFRRRKI